MIRCEGLTKAFKGHKKPVIDGLSFTVPKNAIFGFLGPNGAGKSTSINMIVGLLRPSAGNIFIDGLTIKDRPNEYLKKIGYLSQTPRLFGWMTGKELLEWVGELYGYGSKERKIRANRLLEMSGLTEASHKRISTYSGGMKQRLGIAQAMVGEPEVLILDEPTSSLDPIGRKEVLDFILALKDQCTVLVSTHILSDVERICDELVIINKGRLVAKGLTASILSSHQQRKIVIEMYNESTLNLLLKDLQSLLREGDIRANGLKIEVLGSEMRKLQSVVLSHILRLDIIVKRIEVPEPTLEDVFIQLIENSK
jgi:ABC-2 type transport system ATP-binding protein